MRRHDIMTRYASATRKMWETRKIFPSALLPCAHDAPPDVRRRGPPMMKEDGGRLLAQEALVVLYTIFSALNHWMKRHDICQRENVWETRKFFRWRCFPARTMPPDVRRRGPPMMEEDGGRWVTQEARLFVVEDKVRRDLNNMIATERRCNIMSKM